MSTDRLHCVVLFCTHTTRKKEGDGTEWICSDHWRLADRRLKSLRTRIKCRYRAKRTADNRLKAWRIDCWIWERLKRQAIERAVGISA